MSEGQERNPLTDGADKPLGGREQEAPLADQEVPVLTEVVDDSEPVSALEAGAQALAAEIEREVIRRVTPEIHDIVRRAVRQAVLHALAGTGRRGGES